eukprot:gene16898-biopygen2093
MLQSSCARNTGALGINQPFFLFFCRSCFGSCDTKRREIRYVVAGGCKSQYATLYLPDHLCKVASDLRLTVTLHMVKSDALSDTSNQSEIRRLCESYQRRVLIPYYLASPDPAHLSRGKGVIVFPSPTHSHTRTQFPARGSQNPVRQDCSWSALRADIRALFYRARTYSLEGDGSSDRSVPLEWNHVQRISCYVNDASGDGDWISERGWLAARHRASAGTPRRVPRDAIS